jgi:hypothetical protein
VVADLKTEEFDLAQYLVGTWVPVSDDTFIKSETTFFKNGTWVFEGDFNQDARKHGAPEKILVKGTYKSEKNISIETATEMTPQIMALPDTKRFTITEIKADEHVSTSLATGERNKYRRKNGG